MIEVYSDNYLLYSSNLENLKIFNPKVELEDNKTGSFTFKIYPDHPYYSFIKKMTSIITVYKDDYLLFKGRVLNDEVGFRNEKNITCEGDLAFFLDSVQRPYEFNGSITEFLSKLILEHNSQVDEAKQFTIGRVTVTDPNDYIVRSDSEYTKTWDVIEEKLIGLLGGHISVRHENGVNYVDYLADYDTISNQKIEFSKNLLDLKRIRKGESIITALIPLGAKDEETGKRLTIASENQGSDYIYDQNAVNTYGWIFGTNTWDDVTLAANLLTKGRAYLAGLVNVLNTIELSAADLSGINQNVSAFHLGTYVRVVSKPHEIDQNFLVSKLSIDLLNPANNQLTLGGSIESFTDKTNAIGKIQADIAGTISKTSTDISNAIYQVEASLESKIEQTESKIFSKVSEEYYLKNETDEKISEVSSSLEQTASDFTFKFENYAADMNSLANGTDSKFNEISRYIRFENGQIFLGEIGNELELKIANDRISFLQSNAEVAYFSNNMLHVTDGYYENSLRLGNFAFLPRENGNLSFKKIT